jgi:hypothetical protein
MRQRTRGSAQFRKKTVSGTRKYLGDIFHALSFLHRQYSPPYVAPWLNHHLNMPRLFAVLIFHVSHFGKIIECAQLNEYSVFHSPVLFIFLCLCICFSLSSLGLRPSDVVGDATDRWPVEAGRPLSWLRHPDRSNRGNAHMHLRSVRRDSHEDDLDDYFPRPGHNIPHEALVARDLREGNLRERKRVQEKDVG